MIRCVCVFQANVPLVKFLVEKGARVTQAVNKSGKNVLHLMAEQCMQHKLKPLITILNVSLMVILSITDEYLVDQEASLVIGSIMQSYVLAAAFII